MLQSGPCISTEEKEDFFSGRSRVVPFFRRLFYHCLFLASSSACASGGLRFVIVAFLWYFHIYIFFSKCSSKLSLRKHNYSIY